MVRAGLLIFDLDGTLFRTGPVTVEAARRSLAAFDVTPPEDDEITSFIFHRQAVGRDVCFAPLSCTGREGVPAMRSVRPP